jgi:hypothetical protein
MQTPTGIRKRWADWQPDKTQVFWISAAAVVATLILGFGFAGWTSAGTSREQAEQAANEARHQLATAVCTEEFMRTADARTRLANLQDASWYERDEIVSAGGFATMPDRKEPNIVVAAMCASRLAETRL